jgi:hypothetical protein
VLNEMASARLFQLARGRGGDNAAEDTAALAQLLREFALAGVTVGLERAKAEIRLSSDGGRCKMLSLGDECNCALCRVDGQLKQAREGP